MALAGLALEWQPRPEPLAPVAVAARGAAARGLGRRLLEGPDERLAALTGVAADALLLLLGPEDQLPWCEGAVYLGRDSESPSLLVPTALRPSIPMPLLERAVRSRWPELAPPVALLPGWQVGLSAAEARAIDRALLSAWVEGDG